MGVADERDAVGDRLECPLQARPRRGLAGCTTAGAARGGDAVGGAGEVEEVCSFGLVELQGAGQRVEDTAGGAGDLAALELGVVLDAEAGDSGDLAAPRARERGACPWLGGRPGRG